MELMDALAKAAYIAHHHNGPFDDALEEPNMGRGGFKTEVAVWNAVAQAAIKAIQDAGYVIVPREPTEEMVKAADNATATKWSDEAYEWEEPGELVTSVFTAMIEAFPTANPSS